MKTVYYAYQVETRTFNGKKLPDQIGSISYAYGDTKGHFLFCPIDQMKKREVFYTDTPEELTKILKDCTDYEIRSTQI